MHAIRKPYPVAQQPQTSETQSPEQSASATSGTYFRAVRPTAAEAETSAEGASVISIAPRSKACASNSTSASGDATRSALPSASSMTPSALPTATTTTSDVRACARRAGTDLARLPRVQNETPMAKHELPLDVLTLNGSGATVLATTSISLPNVTPSMSQLPSSTRR
jgi:hypothetical protein